MGTTRLLPSTKPWFYAGPKIQKRLEEIVEQGHGQPDLPSFLAKNPRVKNHSPSLHNWCTRIRELQIELGMKNQLLMEQRSLETVRASMTRQFDLDRMRELTRGF